MTPRPLLFKSLASLIVLLVMVALSPLAPRSFLSSPGGSKGMPGDPTAEDLLSLGSADLSGNLTNHTPSDIVQSSHAPFTALTPILPLPSYTPFISATPTPSPTFTATPSPSFTPTSSPTPTLPVQHEVPAFRVRHQLLGLDCEAAAATQWAGYFGVKINELDFQSDLPRSDNPDYGFVGDVNDAWGGVPPQGYGVYAGPVAALLNHFGVPAVAIKGDSLDQLIAKIAKDIPVIVWVTGHVEPETAYPYIDSQGRQTIVAAYEHVIIVTGYTPTTIHYVSEGEYYTVSIKTFLKSWSVLGNMVVVTP
jgi:uncharacterized protein YvpB